jgi:hypothetical protein
LIVVEVRHRVVEEKLTTLLKLDLYSVEYEQYADVTAYTPTYGGGYFWRNLLLLSSGSHSSTTKNEAQDYSDVVYLY